MLNMANLYFNGIVDFVDNVYDVVDLVNDPQKVKLIPLFGINFSYKYFS